MKLKLSYIPEEEKEAAAVLAALLRLFPGAKVRRDKSKVQKRAVYLTIHGQSGLDEQTSQRYNSPKE